MLPGPTGTMCRTVSSLWKQPAPPPFPERKHNSVSLMTDPGWVVYKRSQRKRRIISGPSPAFHSLVGKTQGWHLQKTDRKAVWGTVLWPHHATALPRPRPGPLGTHHQPCLRKSPASGKMKGDACQWPSEVLVGISQDTKSVPSWMVWSHYTVWAG